VGRDRVFQDIETSEGKNNGAYRIKSWYLLILYCIAALQWWLCPFGKEKETIFG
jgi:hypothetical protein